MEGVMIEELINLKHVVCAADRECKLCSTEILLLFIEQGYVFRVALSFRLSTKLVGISLLSLASGVLQPFHPLWLDYLNNT
jgi:hypothetical protein